MRKIAFLSRGSENLAVQILQGVCEPSGVITRAFIDPAPDMLFHGHGFLARRLDRSRALVARIKAFAPDLIAVSAFTSTWRPQSRLLADLRREVRAPVVVGGIAAVVNPEWIMADPHADMVCVGEGEQAMVAICERLRENRSFEGIPGLWVRGQEYPGFAALTDLTALPPPFKDDYYVAGTFRRLLRVLTGRGCPYACTFCQNNAPNNVAGRQVRRHKPDFVISMLRGFIRRYPTIRRLGLIDANFNARPEYLPELLPRLRGEVGLPYLCQLFARGVDRTVAELLAESGCVGVYMGMEAGDETYRLHVYNKPIRDAQLVEAVECLRRTGIRVTLSMIFGSPGETPRHFARTLEMLDVVRPHHITSFTFFPQWGTQLTEQAIAAGMIEAADIGREVYHGHGDFILRHPFARQVRTAAALAPAYFLAPRSLKRPLLR
jgi:radical SAM superfamily enzyme YgiQ (UPF0313 family)